MSSKNKAPLAPLDVLQRYTIEESAAYLRTSRKSVYEDINAGRLKTIKHGRRRFVPGSEIAKLSAPPADQAA